MSNELDAAVPKLLPCPFCGAVPSTERDGEFEIVICSSEACILGNLAITVGRWNHRVPTERTPRCVHCDPAFVPTDDEGWCDCPCHDKDVDPAIAVTEADIITRSRRGKTPENRTLRIVSGALRLSIQAHGPILPEWTGSAAKRVLRMLSGECLLAPTQPTIDPDVIYQNAIRVAIEVVKKVSVNHETGGLEFPSAVKAKCVAALDKLLASPAPTTVSVETRALRQAASNALLWFSGFPHKGDASDFDKETAEECYNALQLALEEGKKETK